MSNPSHYPHKCPECGAAAYIGGANNVECTGGACRNMSAKLKPLPPGGLMEIAGIPTPREILRDTNNDPRCPTPAEYVGELLRAGSSDLVDQHLSIADSVQPGEVSQIIWENRVWDVGGFWFQDMAKEIRRRLAPTPFCCDGWKTGEHKVDCQAFPFIPGRPGGNSLTEQMATNPKTGLKYSKTRRHPLFDTECKINAGQLGLLEEAHEALKISITNDPRDCRRIESLQERIAKSLCSPPADTVQVPREVLEECRKLAHLEYQRILRGVTPMPERISRRLEKKFLGLWQTLKKLVPLTPTRKESSL